MRKILSLLSTVALIALPATALAQGLKSNLPQSLNGPIKLEILVSEDLEHRANNLPENRAQRESKTRLNGAFSNSSKLGDRSIDFLLHDLKEELVNDFLKRGINASDKASTVLQITIEKAKPNRPTRYQLKQDSNLSPRSYSVGGAEISVNVVSGSGESLGHAYYDYYGTFSNRRFQAPKTWYDASEAFDGFSKALSKKLAKAGVTTS